MALRTLKGVSFNDVTHATETTYRTPREYLQAIKMLGAQVHKVCTQASALVASTTVQRFYLQLAGSVQKITINDADLTDAIKNSETRTIDQRIYTGTPVNLDLPAVDKLKQHYGLLDQLNTKLEILDNLSLQMNHYLSDVKGKDATDRAVRAMRSKLLAEIQKTLVYLNSVSVRAEPKSFKNIANEIIKEAVKLLAGKYKTSEQTSYIGIIEKTKNDHDVIICRYLVLHGLKDENDFEWPHYHIVISGVIDNSQHMHLYINTLSKFTPPGKFRPGHEFNASRMAMQQLESLLNYDQFNVNTDHAKVSIGEEDIDLSLFKMKDNVKSVAVEDDELVVTLKGTIKEKQLDKVIPELYSDVAGLFSVFGKGKMRYSKAKLGNLWQLKFRYTRPDPTTVKEFNMADQKVRTLQQRLGLTNEQVRKVMRALNT